MDWRAINFNWNTAKAFLVTAEEGSLSAAARALGLAQPTLGRQIAALEAELEVALFQRVGRGLVLTKTGAKLLPLMRAMGDSALAASLIATGQSQNLAGKVSIAASQPYAAFLLPAILQKLRASHPEIEIEVVASDTPSDLRRREADIAIRNFQPTEPDLVARKLRTASARLYATPSYLGQIGHPTSLSGFAKASFIGLDSQGTLAKRLAELGLPITPHSFPYAAENLLVMWEMVKGGLGIGMMDSQIADAEPRVQRILPKFPAIEYPVWLVAHAELRNTPRIRVVFDHLAKGFGGPTRT